MSDYRKIISGLHYCSTECSPCCPYNGRLKCSEELCKDVLYLLENKPQTKIGRIRYYESWQSLGEAFVLEISDNGTDWKTVKVFFLVRGMINWDVLKILRDWSRKRIPITFYNEE